ncbi:MAG: DUF4442 domain-containing protein [Bradymonadia bacterium]
MDVYRVLKLIRFWPPYLGAGIYIRSFEKPLNQIVVGMKLNRRNTNYVGTHFGGNLYSMCDPWFMFILMHHLGADYTVWDKAASIDFIRPGRGEVTAAFHIDERTIENIRSQADRGQKVLPEFVVNIVDEGGDIVARVVKTLYVRKKQLSGDHG